VVLRLDRAVVGKVSTLQPAVFCMLSPFLPDGMGEGLFPAEYGLSQKFSVGLLVETHQERPPDPQGRGPEIPRGTDDQGMEGRVVRLFLPEVQMEDLLSLGDEDLIGLASKGERPFGVDRGLLRIDLSQGSEIVLRKEPLRLPAGDSAGAVVGPGGMLQGSLFPSNSGNGAAMQFSPCWGRHLQRSQNLLSDVG